MNTEIHKLPSYALIKPAIDFFGSEAALARALKKRPSHIWHWKRTRVPAEICVDIERESNGKVSRHQLRPDLFDAPIATPKEAA
ncbi:MAG: YdaS family helix-turn-helix protein [Betaproteobacteria bacterium]